MKYNFLLFLVFASFSSYGFIDLKDAIHVQAKSQQVNLSYDQARIMMFNSIDLEKDHRGYFINCVYCGIKYYHYSLNETPTSKLPNPLYMNTEHTWPQSKFSGRFSQSMQKADLHHLYPTLSRINGDRGNLPFAEVNEGHEVYCDTSSVGRPVSGDGGRFFEPPAPHKGNVARALFYFSVRYKIAIDPVQEYFIRQWHILDPVDAREKRRHELIYRIQRNRNPFIDQPELVNQVLDF